MEISRAYETLSDSDKRAHYDRVGHEVYTDPMHGAGEAAQQRGGGPGTGGGFHFRTGGGGGGFDPFEVCSPLVILSFSRSSCRSPFFLESDV